MREVAEKLTPQGSLDIAQTQKELTEVMTYLDGAKAAYESTKRFISEEAKSIVQIHRLIDKAMEGDIKSIAYFKENRQMVEDLSLRAAELLDQWRTSEAERMYEVFDEKRRVITLGLNINASQFAVLPNKPLPTDSSDAKENLARFGNKLLAIVNLLEKAKSVAVIQNAYR